MAKSKLWLSRSKASSYYGIWLGKPKPDKWGDYWEYNQKTTTRLINHVEAYKIVKLSGIKLEKGKCIPITIQKET